MDVAVDFPPPLLFLCLPLTHSPPHVPIRPPDKPFHSRMPRSRERPKFGSLARMRWRGPRGISWEPSVSRQVIRTGWAWQALMVTSDTCKNTKKKRNMQINFSGDEMNIYNFTY